MPTPWRFDSLEGDDNTTPVYGGAEPYPSPEPQPNPNAEVVPTVPGVGVDGGVNAARIRELANSLYPLGNTPQMVYGEDVNIPLPFTKKKIHIGGERMDRLASAIAAAAGNAYVPGSDTGGQLLKGFLQGYSGIRSKDYATRKAEYEKRVAEAKAQKEARDKFLAQLGVAGYTASMKPKPGEKPSTMVKVTKQLIEQANAMGLNIPAELEGQFIDSGKLVRSPDSGDGIGRLNYEISKSNRDLGESRAWQSSKDYENYNNLSAAYTKISDIVKEPKNPANTKALTNLINNVMDPTSATLLAEAARWSGQSGAWSALETLLNQVTGTGIMDEKTRLQIKQLADTIYGGARNTFKNRRQQAIQRGALYGIPESIYMDIPDVEQRELVAPGATTSRAGEVLKTKPKPNQNGG